MVWKSNLDETDQEYIEEFGAKESPQIPEKQTGGVPPVSQRKPATASKKPVKGVSAGKGSARKVDSP